MIIAVDIGNTNIVTGIFDDKDLKFTERLVTDKNKTTEEYKSEFEDIFTNHNILISEISGIAVSSVVPEVMDIIKKVFFELIPENEIFIINNRVNTGLNILTDNPEKVGADRLADASAVLSEYPLPALVIDMGTATTLSVIDENKNFLGGIIMAGVKTTLNALVEKTAQLPEILFESSEISESIIGRNTSDAMKNGAVYGTSACLDGMISKIEKELGKKLTVIATGGIADIIVPYCDHKIIYDENLLLKGIFHIYKLNDK